MTRAHVGLGSNVGDPVGNVLRALDALTSLGTVVQRSSLYRTKPWGKTDQPDFINAVAALDTGWPAGDLLRSLKTLEVRLGRTEGERWGPRVIDLDLLTYGEAAIDEPALRVPHPHLARRAFVLVPLAEIEPRYAALRDALDPEEIAGVSKVLRPFESP
jgi:2-amino-4-hydroxy-6-hydroxymethyldihydropteridine diphosphokinase